MEESTKLAVRVEKLIRNVLRPVAILASVPMLITGGSCGYGVSPNACVAGAILAGLVMISYSLDRRAAPPT